MAEADPGNPLIVSEDMFIDQIVAIALRDGIPQHHAAALMAATFRRQMEMEMHKDVSRILFKRDCWLSGVCCGCSVPR